MDIHISELTTHPHLLDEQDKSVAVKKLDAELFCMQLWLPVITLLICLGLVGLEGDPWALIKHFSISQCSNTLDVHWPLMAGIVLLVLHVGRMIPYIEQRAALTSR